MVHSSSFVVKTRKDCMKKQTQFDGGIIGVSSYLKGYYENKPACRARKNKANSNPIRQEGTAGEGLFGKMGDTGLEPVTSCVSSRFTTRS